MISLYFHPRSKKIASLLLGLIRIQGGATSFVSHNTKSALFSHSKNLLTYPNRAFFGASSDNNSNMSDEVAAAKAAAVQYKSSDADGEWVVVAVVVVCAKKYDDEEYFFA